MFKTIQKGFTLSSAINSLFHFYKEPVMIKSNHLYSLIQFLFGTGKSSHSSKSQGNRVKKKNVCSQWPLAYHTRGIHELFKIINVHKDIKSHIIFSEK